MNVNANHSLKGLGDFFQKVVCPAEGADKAQETGKDAVGKPSVTIAQSSSPAGIGDVEVTSEIEADIGFNDDIAQLFGGYAFTSAEIPPLKLEQ